ncbi:MAG: hypothetical protein J7M14_02940, partial [Planctomycetes bacterium]|nr:hypothetical protein [Planctomycetota bacterium]
MKIGACKAVMAIMCDDILTTAETRIAQLGIDSPAAARSAGMRAVTFSEEIAPAVEQLQAFLLEKVYLHPESLKHERTARMMITDLFAAYIADPSLLPPRFSRRIGDDSLHRVVCDYIAGMTTASAGKSTQSYAPERKRGAKTGSENGD